MTPYTLHNTVFIITVEIISCLYTIIHFFYKILRYIKSRNILYFSALTPNLLTYNFHLKQL